MLAFDYDSKCDIWSCGVILYVFLYGFPPFNGRNDEEIFQKIRKGVFRFPDSPRVSEEVKAVVAKMLTKDPAQRPTAEALLKDPWFAKMKTNGKDFEGSTLSIKTLKEF